MGRHVSILVLKTEEAEVNEQLMLKLAVGTIAGSLLLIIAILVISI